MIGFTVIISLAIAGCLGITIFSLINDKRLSKENKYITQGVKGAVRAMDKKRIISLSEIDQIRDKLPKFDSKKK